MLIISGKTCFSFILSSFDKTHDRSLKSIQGFWIFFLFGCFLSTIWSCSKVCQTGYANPNCSIEIRAPYENLYYTVTESMNHDSAYSYSAAIISSQTGPFALQLTNVANGLFVNNVNAQVSITGDSLTIARQAPDTNARYIQGLGTLSNNVLTINFTISYPDSIPVLHTQTDSFLSVWIHP
jgi:hypothetical protein